MDLWNGLADSTVSVDSVHSLQGQVRKIGLLSVPCKLIVVLKKTRRRFEPSETLVMLGSQAVPFAQRHLCRGANSES